MPKSLTQTETIRVRFPGYHTEIPKIDSATGKYLDRGKTTNTSIQLSTEIFIRGLYQGIPLIGHIEKPAYAIEKLAAKVRAATLKELSNKWIYDLFTTTEFHLNTRSQEFVELEAEIQIDQDYADKLEAQARRGNETIKCLRTTLKDLEDLVTGRPSDNRHEINEKLSFLDRCSDAQSGFPSTGATCEIRSCLTELFKRKNPRHTEYLRYQEILTSRLSRWPVSNVWRQQPPSI